MSLRGGELRLGPNLNDPAHRVTLSPHSHTVIRFVLEDELTVEEADQVVYSERSVVEIDSNQLFAWTHLEYKEYGERHVETEEPVAQELSIGGRYSATIHITAACPGMDEIGGEPRDEYWRRTRPDLTEPSFLLDPSETGDLWVGIIVTLFSAPTEPATKPARRATNPCKATEAPPLCPLGILSPNAEGRESYLRQEPIFTQPVKELTRDISPVKIEGGPVNLRLDDLCLMHWIPWICGETHPWLRLSPSLPFQFQWPTLYEGVDAKEVDGAWEVSVEGSNANWSPFRHMRMLGPILAQAPDGSKLEIASASEESDGAEGFHVASGSVKDGVWHIDSHWPKLSADHLSQMLDLARQGEASGPIKCLSAEEARQVETLYNAKDFLLSEDPPTRRGGVFEFRRKDQKDFVLRARLISRIFSVRFSDVIPILDSDDDLQEFNSLLDSVAKAGAAWAVGDVVHEGAFATYTKAPDASDGARHTPPAMQWHDWLLDNAFEHLGDLNSTQTFSTVIRAYAQPGTATYAAIILPHEGGAMQDFFSTFADGWTVTTAIGDGSGNAEYSSNRKLRNFRLESSLPIGRRAELHSLKVEDECEEHDAEIVVGGLVDFTQALDDFMVRVHGKAKR